MRQDFEKDREKMKRQIQLDFEKEKEERARAAEKQKTELEKNIDLGIIPFFFKFNFSKNHLLKVRMGRGLRICELIGANQSQKEFRLLLDLGKVCSSPCKNMVLLLRFP